MPNNETEKTKSAHSGLPFWIAAGLLVVLVALVFLVFFVMLLMGKFSASRTNATLVVQPGLAYNLSVTDGEIAQSGDHPKNSIYYLEEAAGTPRLEKGLSGRHSLPRNEGMLFVFDDEKKQCFWMKDMRFPLDIIWVDGQKKVVHVEHNVSPKTYPKLFCHKPTKYVIELNAGEAAKSGLRAGQVLNF